LNNLPESTDHNLMNQRRWG